MPCGKDTLNVKKKLFDQKQIAKFSEEVLKRKVFAFEQVDIEVPNEVYDKFSEMPPLFVVQEIPDCNIPEEMKIYKEKLAEKQWREQKNYWVLWRQKRSFCTLLWLNGIYDMG